MFFRLLKGLQGFPDIELAAILLNEGKLSDDLRKFGIPVYIADESRLNFYQIVRNVRQFIAQTSPDVVHSHRLKENVLAYHSICSKKKNIPLVATQHGMKEPIYLHRKKAKNMILMKYNCYLLSKHFKFIVVVSNDMRDRLAKQLDFPNSRVQVIYNGTEIFNYDEPKKNEGTFVIGSAGRLFPVKDFPFMVEVAREVLKRNSTIRFELAGEGPEEERIRGLIRQYDIQKYFTLRGFVENMETFYEGLDIYINTSWHEGLPMTILEAMSHGLPVIALNIGGVKEILNDGVDGYLVEERDPAVFADKCLRLVGDHKLCEKMGRESNNTVREKFSLDLMAKKYRDLYLRSIKESGT